ncbi:hypothetical protein SCUP234_07286 [Seiridium cupressi]
MAGVPKNKRSRKSEGSSRKVNQNTPVPPKVLYWNAPELDTRTNIWYQNGFNKAGECVESVPVSDPSYPRTGVVEGLQDLNLNNNYYQEGGFGAPEESSSHIHGDSQEFTNVPDPSSSPQYIHSNEWNQQSSEEVANEVAVPGPYEGQSPPLGSGHHDQTMLPGLSTEPQEEQYYEATIVTSESGRTHQSRKGKEKVYHVGDSAHQSNSHRSSRDISKTSHSHRSRRNKDTTYETGQLETQDEVSFPTPNELNDTGYHLPGPEELSAAGGSTGNYDQNYYNNYDDSCGQSYEVNNEEFEQARLESLKDAYAVNAGEPSHASASSYGVIAEDTKGDMTGADTPVQRQPEQNTLPHLVPKYRIFGTGGNFEDTDDRYKVQPGWRFAPGAVFKILWSEPRGSAVVIADDFVSDIRPIENDFYVSYRRFIIVATDEGNHSTCVPILTYERQGCKKPGVKPKGHGMVYSDDHRKPPSLLKHEPDLGFKPVMVTMEVEEGLAKESRANYSKLVTVEHNVKVFFIGTIKRSHFRVVKEAVDKCWENKKSTQPEKHSRKKGHRK